MSTWRHFCTAPDTAQFSSPVSKQEICLPDFTTVCLLACLLAFLLVCLSKQSLYLKPRECANSCLPCLPAYSYLYLPPSLPTCLLSVCQPACLRASSSVSLSTCIPPPLSLCLPPCMSASQSAWAREPAPQTHPAAPVHSKHTHINRDKKGHNYR